METNDKQRRNPQPIRMTRKFASTEPRISTIGDRMFYEFQRGTLERQLSIRYETRREMVEAVIRRKAQQQDAEIKRLKAELWRMQVAA